MKNQSGMKLTGSYIKKNGILNVLKNMKVFDKFQYQTRSKTLMTKL